VGIEGLHAVGGGARSALWLALKADICGLPLRVTAVTEAACLGAALLAGVGAGVYASLAEAVQEAVRLPEERLVPDPVQQVAYEERYRVYRELYPALMLLEAEGLVERRFDGRYVIELSEGKIRDLHEVRWTLEKLAVRLAAANASEGNRAALHARVCDLEEAVATGDPALCAKCDLAIHQTIWHQANNSYWPQVLGSVLGVIFVLAARVRAYERDDSDRLLSLHRELAELVASGDGDGAAQAVEVQLGESLMVSLRTFRIQEHGDASDS
jgi:DNA-binding GntR family transcriptional regulator